MKKILIACRAYYPDVAGGGELSTKSLAENLKKNGYDVEVVAVSDHDGIEVIEGIKITRVKYKNLYWSFSNDKKNNFKKLAWHILDANNLFIGKKISDLLDFIKPDILITSTIEDISTITWKVAKNKGIRVVHILRSYTLLCSNANMYKNDNCNSVCNSCRTLTVAKKINSRYVDDVIGISNFILDRHIKEGYFPNAKGNVIYNICLGDIQEKIKNSLSKNIVIGYLGRIHKTKGIELIFDAIKKIPSELKNNIVIKIAGSGDDEYITSLKSLSNRESINSFFLGSVGSKEFLDGIDLLIVPSRWHEPFGRVVVESLGRGVPVAAKKVGGIPELLSDNEGFLFDNDEQLKEIIEKFMQRELDFSFSLDRFTTKNIMLHWKKLLG